MSSVAIVVLDTLRKDSFDEHFDWLPGLRFENAWSTSHWTVPAHASLFTGKYPSELGVYTGHHSLNCTEATIAEQLLNSGYTTRAFSANPYLSPVFDFDRGFEYFTGNWRLKAFDPDIFDWNTFINNTSGTSILRFPKAVLECFQADCATIESLSFGLKLKMRDMSIGPYTDDGARNALDWVREQSFNSDEFVFINLMEAHAPYEPPSSYQSVDPPDLDRAGTTFGIVESNHDNDKLKTAYEDCVRYLSDMYKEIHKELLGEFDYVVTLGDHGELFGERNAWGHTYSVAPELVNIPLVIYGPDLDGDHHSPVSILDVYQTLCDICDIESDSHGRDLRSQPEDGMFLTQYTGLRPGLRERIESAGKDSTDFDEWCYGVALPYDYYGYQTLDGFVESGKCKYDDPQRKLEDLISQTSIRELSSKSPVPENVKDQLERLGYA